MKMEIENASKFLANLVRLQAPSLKASRVELFRLTLTDVLKHHYQHHWFPDKPFKGSGYRCIRINHKMDPLIAKTGGICGFDEARLRQLLPNELTLWIDPQEVSYRIGENGSICVLYDGKKNQFSENVRNANNCRSNFNYPPMEIRYPGCKESFRRINSWDSFVMDPRNTGFEQLSAYVSG